jgi:glycolate oxidase
MDATPIAAVDEATHMQLDRTAAALLVIQTDPIDADTITRICTDHAASMVATSSDPDEATALLAARRAAYPALERLGATLLDDIAVPRTQIPALLAHCEQTAQQTGVTIGVFGHAGDGNLHPTIVYDADSTQQAAAARRAFTAILSGALELGGTVTGEHGVGALKPEWLTDELDPTVAELHHQVKTLFDPAGILNPGRALPPQPGAPPLFAGPTTPIESEAPLTHLRQGVSA